MVSGLIEQEDVSPEEHSPGEGELHLPTTRQRTDCLGLTFVTEADRGECLDDVCFGGEDTLVTQNELEN